MYWTRRNESVALPDPSRQQTAYCLDVQLCSNSDDHALSSLPDSETGNGERLPLSVGRNAPWSRRRSALLFQVCGGVEAGLAARCCCTALPVVATRMLHAIASHLTARNNDGNPYQLLLCAPCLPVRLHACGIIPARSVGDEPRLYDCELVHHLPSFPLQPANSGRRW
jgi:hypothetical protein